MEQLPSIVSQTDKNVKRRNCNNMIYLQKVIACIENEKYLPDLEKLGKALQAEGLEFRCFVGNHIFDSHLLIDGRMTVSEREKGLVSATRKPMPRLWITDSAKWAASLRLQKEAVLALLHEENKTQDFSDILYACENVGEMDAEYMEKVYRRYANIPWDIIETDRCYIRETTEADVDAFWEIYQNEEITRYTEGLYPTIEKEKQYAKEYREKVYGFYGFGVWTILKKETGEIIGRAGFSYRDGYEEPEIGFVIGVPWQGQGYAYEVCSALLEYGKVELGFENVQAFVVPENEASVKLCRKLGMECCGQVKINQVLHSRFYSDGLWYPAADRVCEEGIDVEIPRRGC